jgi:hypothetical protein
MEQINQEPAPPLQIRVDPVLHARLKSLVGNRPILTIETSPGKPEIELDSPTLEDFVATGITMRATAFYVRAQPMKEVVNPSFRRDIDRAASFLWHAESVDELARRLGVKGTAAMEFAAELAKRYPRMPGDPKYDESRLSSFPVDEPGGHVVYFVVHGSVHAFYMTNRLQHRRMLEQLESDTIRLHESEADVLRTERDLVGIIVEEIDRSPDYRALIDSARRYHYIKEHYHTTYRIASRVEELSFCLEED